MSLQEPKIFIVFLEEYEKGPNNTPHFSACIIRIKYENSCST